jgi:putative YphP/YqiW family bacilliredoxin
MYDPAMVQPMRDELTSNGFEEARTAIDVSDYLDSDAKTTLFYVNSVCGCAAGIARPGIVDSLKSAIVPDKLVTAFAGNDKEAVTAMRDSFIGYAPSSPCAGLFRDGELVFMMERHQIEGQSQEVMSKILSSAYAKFCGPEVNESVEIFDPMASMEITVAKAKESIAKGDVAILDVREPFEIEAGSIEGFQAVTNELANTIVKEWDKSKEIIVYCAHGQRSLQAVQFLQSHGFDNAKSLQGGFAAWN